MIILFSLFFVASIVFALNSAGTESVKSPDAPISLDEMRLNYQRRHDRELYQDLCKLQWTRTELVPGTVFGNNGYRIQKTTSGFRLTKADEFSAERKYAGNPLEKIYNAVYNSETVLDPAYVNNQS